MLVDCRTHPDPRHKVGVIGSLRGPRTRDRRKIALATLTFHAVTDLKIAIDSGDSGNRLLLQPLSIAEITREPTHDPAYHAWRVRLGWPRGGEITFGATGFEQVLLAEPIISETNVLTAAQRRQMLG